MKEQACSNHSIIATAVLSSYRVLNVLKATAFNVSLSEGDLREAVYLTYQPWAARQPDHIFEYSWQWLLRKTDDESRFAPDWAAISLRQLANEFVEFRHGAARIKLNKFGAWQQSVLSRVGGLAIQAFATVSARDWMSESRRTEEMRRVDGKSLCELIAPYDASVEDYIGREGLHETHLHLNGSTHAEICWLRALLEPDAEVREFDKKWNSTTNPHASKLRELVRSVNPDLTPAEISRQLRVAAQLRKWLQAAASGLVDDDLVIPHGYEELAYGSAPLPPLTSDADKLSDLSGRGDELTWMTKVIEHLRRHSNVIYERMFHLYLILQNQYYRLLVQSEEQFGFDQFQKLTYTDLREPAERDYYQRFVTMHGDTPNTSRIVYLEGRFAPKDTIDKNSSLLHAVLVGYLRYLRGSHRQLGPVALSAVLSELDEYSQSEQESVRRVHRLALVAHFIKLPWSHEPKDKAGPYRFCSLRVDLEERTNILLSTLTRWPGLRNWVRGIDAAANELHAPPEVFASIFRVCRYAGLTRRSYHVGEDFTHLVSGLRHMSDAIDLLELETGDRIGHGTAMGISPKLWVERMPGQLVVKKGDWMLDLLAAWQMLRQIPEETAEAYRVEGMLSDLASEIFEREVNCSTLGRVMKLRGLNVRYLMKSNNPSWNWKEESDSALWSTEVKRVAEARKANPGDVALLVRWLGDANLWSRSEQLMEVETAFFDTSTFVRLQQVLMRLVRDKGIVIETLPSSNVRISQYHSFAEHHALRWMRVPGYVEENDPEIMVSLGSDDPGIFAGDLNGEFYQLYAAVRSVGLGDKTALDYLAPLNERGRQYRFHAAGPT
ncbi:adenosine deaminase [Caballeronia udeis]|uniref:Adenosine deaminase n=1 Tax=Caballeronia udeis TaxID=1232866 RepID=A0A158F7T8_9BURK|nr:hypothetical protein [Caballeronia udeis]SAL15419.1 adenosine deaminase [Caballeronia udeis]